MKVFFDFKLVITALLLAAVGIALGLFISSRWLFTPGNVQPGDYREYFSNERTEVIMLGTLWCPICAKTRKFLTEENIQFVEYDVDASEEGKSIAVKLGQTDVVPIVILRDRIIRGFNPDDLKKSLQSTHIHSSSSEASQVVSLR